MTRKGKKKKKANASTNSTTAIATTAVYEVNETICSDEGNIIDVHGAANGGDSLEPLYEHQPVEFPDYPYQQLNYLKSDFSNESEEDEDDDEFDVEEQNNNCDFSSEDEQNISEHISKVTFAEDLNLVGEQDDLQYFWTVDDDVPGQMVLRKVEPDRGEMYSAVKFLFPKRYSKKCGVMMYLSEEGIRQLNLIERTLSPFVDLKLRHELSRTPFVTLYYDSWSVKNFISMIVRFYDSSTVCLAQTRLLDLKYIPGNETFEEEDVVRAISESIRNYDLSQKIVSIIGDNPLVTSQLTLQFELLDLADVPPDITDILCEIFDSAIRESLPFGLLKYIDSFQRHFADPRNVKKMAGYHNPTNRFPFDGKFECNPAKWRLDGWRPVYSRPDTFLSLLDTVLHKMERYWSDLKKYFCLEHEDIPTEAFSEMRWFFTHSTMYAWFHLFFMTDFVPNYVRTIQHIQYPEAEFDRNIVSRVCAIFRLGLYLGQNQGPRLAERCLYVLNSANSEAITQFEQESAALALNLQKGIVLNFGKLFHQFVPLSWIKMDELITPEKVAKSFSCFPDSVISKLNQKELFEEVRLVMEYQMARVPYNCAPYKRFITRLENWNLGTSTDDTRKSVNSRWHELFTTHPGDQLKNLRLMADYLFSLPIGHDSTVREIYEDIVDFWEQERSRFPDRPDVTTVRAAIRARHNDIRETKRDIETVLKDPEKLEEVVSARKAAILANARKEVKHSTSQQQQHNELHGSNGTSSKSASNLIPNSIDNNKKVKTKGKGSKANKKGKGKKKKK